VLFRNPITISAHYDERNRKNQEQNGERLIRKNGG
jgi:hypothetical protein